MKRFAAMIAVIFVIVGSAQAVDPPVGPGPRLVMATIRGGSLVIEEIVTKTVIVTETRNRVVDGRQIAETVSVPKIVHEAAPLSYSLKGVAAFDLDGRTILLSRLTAMLKEKKAIAISTVGKLGQPFRSALRDDVPVVVLPPLEP